MAKGVRILVRVRFFVLCCAFLGVVCATGVALSVSPKRAVAEVHSIVAVVNDDVITGKDLDKRLRLVMASSGFPDTKEIRQKLTGQVLGNLINEQIMLQEAEKLGMEVDQNEINDGFAHIARQNNMNPDQFMTMLNRVGVDVNSMFQQVRAQIAWGKVVQSQLRRRVVISERDIDDTLERIRAKIGTTEYHAAEIFLPVDDAAREQQVRRVANDLVREIRSGKVPFSNVAQQFSQAAGATNGGDKGWVNEAQLSDELLKGLKGINKGQITNPIKTANGYYILLLRDKRTLSEDTIPSREQIKFDIGNERMERLQRQRLMDLRLASFIDVRI